LLDSRITESSDDTATWDMLARKGFLVDPTAAPTCAKFVSLAKQPTPT
jgi:hypothetical protein